MTLVTSALPGTITIWSSTVMLLKALSSNSSPSSVSATALERSRAKPCSTRLEAGAGPLEVDVRRVAAAQQVGQADRLVQVVVLEVELDRDARVGLLEGGAGGLPHGDLRLARRAHRHAQG